MCSRVRFSAALLAVVVTYCLMAFSSPARAAENATLQNVVLDTGGATYRMKTIVFVGSNLTQAQLSALFDKNSSEALIKRFSSLSAASVTIPELIIERPLTNGIHSTTMLDVVFRDISGGKAATMTVKGGSMKTPGDTATFGAMNAKDLDIALMASLYTEDANSALRPILKEFNWEALQYKTDKGGTFRFDRITSPGVQMRAGALKTPSAKPDDKTPKYAFPAAGSVTFSGVSMEFPDSSAKGEMHKWTIREIVLASDQLRGDLPSAIKLVINDWSAAVGPNSPQGLRDLGYESVLASLRFEGIWNEPANEFIVKAVAADFAQIGSVTISATLGNVKREMFSGNGEAIAAAAQGVTAKILAVAFENKGLYERAVAMLSKRDGSKPEDVRKKFELIVAKTAPILLGSSSNAKIITKGISDFLAKPGTLEITAKSKNSAGVPLSDFKPVGISPAPSIDKLDVTTAVK